MRVAIPPLLQYAFMAWCSVNHRDNFTLPHRLQQQQVSLEQFHCRRAYKIRCSNLKMSVHLLADSLLDGKETIRRDIKIERGEPWSPFVKYYTCIYLDILRKTTLTSVRLAVAPLEVQTKRLSYVNLSVVELYLCVRFKLSSCSVCSKMMFRI
jgi:hypothetical protein